MVPWDATLGKFLEMNITSSYNTDAKNIYKISFVGEFTNWLKRINIIWLNYAINSIL